MTSCILYKAHDPFKWNCMWGTNKSYRLVLYNLFEDCFAGNILFFAIVCISDGVFLKNIFVWEMFEGDNNKKNPKPYCYIPHGTKPLQINLKTNKLYFFVNVDKLGFLKTVHPISPDWSRLVDVGFRATGPKQWKLATWSSHDSATRAPSSKFWFGVRFNTQSQAVIHTQPDVMCAFVLILI